MIWTPLNCLRLVWQRTVTFRERLTKKKKRNWSRSILKLELADLWKGKILFQASFCLKTDKQTIAITSVSFIFPRICYLKNHLLFNLFCIKMLFLFAKHSNEFEIHNFFVFFFETKLFFSMEETNFNWLKLKIKREETNPE